MKRTYLILGLIIIIAAVVFWMDPGDDTANLPPANDMKHAGTQIKNETNSLKQKQSENGDDNDSKGASRKNLRSSEEDPDLSAVNPDYSALEMRLDEMSARRNGQAFDPDSVKAAMQKSSAWETGELPANDPDLSEEELHDGREFINFDRLKLESLVNGDTLEMPLNQTGQTYKATVSQTESNQDGSVTWHGKLLGIENSIDYDPKQKYEMSITSGKQVVSGSIYTPDGLYVINAVGDKGWIANAGTLYKQKENEPCSIEPEGHDK